MASPFSIFRKHQRAMMAAVGILCMVAFTLGGVASFDNLASNNSQDPLVATTRFGDYRETDLRNMRLQRQLALSFLAGVKTKISLLRFDEKIRAQIENSDLFRNFAQVEEQELQNRFGSLSDSSLIESRVLAAEAKRRGLVVNDEAIDAYLRTETNDQMTGRQYTEALANLSRNGQRVSKAMLYDALRTELLAYKLRENFVTSLVPTPAQRWDYYQRLRRRVRVELVPVKAKDFVAQIKDPSTEVARKFYDQYAEEEPIPGSPEPGFKLPHLAEFEYIEAHYDHFFKPETVTDDDVKSFYAKNKDARYLYNEMAFENSLFDEETADAKAESDKKAAKKADDDKKAAEKKAADEKKTGEKKPDDKPAAKEPAAEKEPKAKDDQPAGKDDKPADKKPEAKPKDEKPADEKPKDDKPADDSDSESSCGADPAQDENSADDEDKPAATETKPADAKSADAKSADAKSADAKSTDEPAAETAPSAPALTIPGQTPPAADDAPGEAPVHPELQKPKTEAKPLPPQLTERYMLPNSITQGAKPKYEPLWRVEEAIRKELAGDNAVKAMEKSLKELQVKLGSYSRSLVEWESKKKKEPNATKPTAPSFTELAKDVPGLSVGNVPLGAAYDVIRAPGIGASNVRGMPFVSFGFQSVRKFQANIAEDNDGNRYLFWKTDDQESRVPKFEEIQTHVVEVWKMREAREPMLARAKALAKEAQESGKSLKDAFAAQKLPVAEPPTFSWLTMGTAGTANPNSQPRMSEVADTEDVGPGFMRSVYDLETGDVGVAENHPHTIAYVVRMTNSSPPQTLLRDTFLADRFENYVSVALAANREIFGSWLEEQLADAKLHWERPPAEQSRFE